MIFRTTLVTGEPRGTILMCDMAPNDIGIVEDNSDEYDGVIVMRTPEIGNHIVINLSRPISNNFWTSHCTLPVKLLRKGEKIEIEIQ